MRATPLVLIIDDDMLRATATTHSLTTAGYSILSAGNGEVGFRMVIEHVPDLVLLDVILPDINGIEICRRIKKHPGLEDVFVVLFSGANVASEQQAAGLEGGADGYIAQPVSTRELLARTAAMLRISRSQQEAKARIRQQALVASLGLEGLTGGDLGSLFRNTVNQLAGLLNVEFCGVLLLQADKRTFCLTAGAGWPREMIDRTCVPNDASSLAGFTLQLGSPVLIEDLIADRRFRSDPLFLGHGVVSGTSVIIAGQHGPLGILNVCSRSTRSFTGNDLHFLQSLANVLAAALERQAADDAIRSSEQALLQYSQKLEELVARRAEELSKAQGRMQPQGKHARLDDLVNRIAVDLHNPIGLISQAARYLEANLEDDDPLVREYLGTILTEAEHSAAIVRGLLKLSRDLAAERISAATATHELSQETVAP